MIDIFILRLKKHRILLKGNKLLLLLIISIITRITENLFNWNLRNYLIV